jgi:hypothetical protein
MVKTYFTKNLLYPIQQISPLMLLLSLTIHGLLLLIPLSSSLERNRHDTTAFNQQPIFVSKEKSGELFSDSKALVKQRDLTSTPIPTIDPEFIAQLPSLPSDATAQTQLQIPVEATPKLPPNVIPTVAPSKIASNEKLIQYSTDQTAAVIVAAKTTSPKKQNLERVVIPVKTPVTSPTVVPSVTLSAPAKPKVEVQPETSPTQEEKEIFDSAFDKLDNELNLRSELNFSQPENFAPTVPGIQDIHGTATGKPEEVAKNVKSKLEAQGFKASQINTYASGLVYVVTKNKSTYYITFTPNLEGTGTIIVTWSKSPVPNP